MKINKELLGKINVLLVLVFIACSVFVCGGSAETKSDALREITVSSQPSFESFTIYWAIKQGFMEKHGIDAKMMYFDSGMPQIEALPSKQWDIGAVGSVPALFASLRYGVYIVSVIQDDSDLMRVLARPESSIFDTKGYNPNFPDVYGAPEDLIGSQALVTTVATIHYTLGKYLDALGVSESDLKIVNLEQPQAFTAFDSGVGDTVSLWSPFNTLGMEKGWKVVAKGSDVGARALLVWIASKEWADENVDLIVDFLDAFYEAQEDLLFKQGSILANEYVDFMMDWCGLEISEIVAKGDFENEIAYTIEEHLKYLENGTFAEWTKDSLDYFVKQGRFTQEERESLEAINFGITDKFMKLLAQKREIVK